MNARRIDDGLWFGEPGPGPAVLHPLVLRDGAIGGTMVGATRRAPQ